MSVFRMSSSSTTMATWHGRVIARLVPPIVVASNSIHKKKPQHAQIDFCSKELLKSGTGELGPEEILKRRCRRNQKPQQQQQQADENSDVNAGEEAMLTVHLYNQGAPPMVLNLNRDAHELVSNTLRRMELSLHKKKMQQPKVKRKSGVAAQPTPPPPAESAPRLWRLEECQNGELVKGSELIDTAKVTNHALWKHGDLFCLEMGQPPPSSSNDSNVLRFLVEANLPFTTSVQTFEDFTACLFPGVPVVVNTETIHATDCRVDWYVNGQLRKNDSPVFVPAETDVDATVAVLLTPYSAQHDGQGLQEAYQFQRSVQTRPENTLLNIRQPEWTTTRPRTDGNLLRIVSYNILADQNAFQLSPNTNQQIPFYPYVTKETLLKTRRLPLILHELLAYHADVLCLQEVDESVFERLLQPVLHEYGYNGYFACKQHEGGKEGPAVFWRSERFEQDHSYEARALCDLLPRNEQEENHDDAWSDSTRTLQELFGKKPDVRQVLEERLGHVAQYLSLVDKETGLPLCVVNTHLFYHRMASHMRLIQIYLLAKHAAQTKLNNNGDTALVVCGDFNSSLNNAAGKLLVDRRVPANYRDLKEDLNTFDWNVDRHMRHLQQQEEEEQLDFPEFSLPESFPVLASALLPPLPSFTHHVGGFSAVLDHVLVSSHLVPVRSAPMLSEEDATKNVAMPSPTLPSDHVSVVCDVRIEKN